MNARNEEDETPLHFAAWSDASPTIIQLLVETGALVNTQDGRWGFTPLHWAAVLNPTIITALVEAGAELEARTKLRDSTPLHIAAELNPNLAIVTAPLDAGANAAARDD